MFIASIIVTLLILFSIVDIADKINEKIHNKSKYSLTGNIVSEKSMKNEQLINITFENYTDSEFKKSELYQTKSAMIYYLMLIGIIASILVIGITLRSIMIENIKKEVEEEKV